ncbi:phosphoribosylformylglycinamidine synthase subunit PurL [Catalinimonas niigatensis]|uniref:phosphoribosylformylglycinamidine synthase subunit PurL n=1 Tax=Catalinimonas niigatensis TaxID=1397264 RepID=UPI002665F6E7|nr:phosphoribosylformylglycinamidine synthase subunit PurL [Catalinimonas niigatensis]WPP50270.1 phosphoribosylformylglycinamidine synthase subunit PurL [Catalinimonas niigatensis]
MKEELTTVQTALDLGLLKEEFEKIKEILGRTPNFTELSIFSVMWSEHCSYKNSIVWLKKLPKSSERMLAEAGEENAGLVDIGDGLACSFKIESHNHPSAIEPYQGAATGVGGINRDIFTMGARPIAQLNSLRFGDLTNKKTQWLLKGVVKGIGDYGNAFGIPTVGGELYFDPCYQVNPLVNAFSAGIVETDKIASAISYGVGNPVFIVGSATGKDGIHGAAFASKDISEDSLNDLPSVQVGDPFQEKLLLEASLEVIASGAVIGIQDMGAAGIICSTSEMSAKGEHGMDIWLDKVPLRQEGMLPFEILLSESQERMLIVVKKGREQEVLDIFKKWDLNCAQIGEVTKDKRLKFYQNGDVVADVPAYDLVLGGGAPVYHREYKEPAYYQEFKKFDPNTIPQPKSYAEVAKFLLSHPNIASRKWVSEQYDSMIGTGTTTTNAPADAPVVRIKGTNKAILVTVDCNGRYVHADPEEGCAIAVAESSRNVVCSGGEPVAITNCLNFGNPFNPEVYWQFVKAITGMKKACEKFSTPVTGGNVSFYNQSNDGGAVFPTPVIGMLGLLDHYDRKMTMHFKNGNDPIYLIGKMTDDIACSEYLYSYCKVKGSSSPYFDINEEYQMQEAIKSLISKGLIVSAHDISDGGLFVALAESALAGNLGFSVLSDSTIRKDAFLFGEGQGRVLISLKKEFTDIVEADLNSHSVHFQRIGKVTKDSFKIDDEELMELKEAKKLYFDSLASFLS